MTRINGVQDSFNSLIDYLRNYSISGIITDEVSGKLRSLHKNLYALLCWKIELESSKSNDKESEYFFECLSDLIQIIPLLSQGFYKAVKLLHRGSVENFLRWLVVKCGGDIEKFCHTYQYFEFLKTAHCGDILYIRLIDDLRETYARLCRYVHTSGSFYCTFSQALNEFPAYNNELFKDDIEDLCNTINVFNQFMIKCQSVLLDNMFPGNKDAILDSLSKTQKRELLDTFVKSS
jgi:hypothetical protein